MSKGITGITALAGLAALLALLPTSEALGQGAIGFQPNVQPFNDGVFLNATPVVSADRRYVRMGGINTSFNAIQGVQPFTFNAGAVSGGGFGGGFGNGGNLGGLGGVGGLAGGNFGNLNNGVAVVPGLGAVGPVNGFYPGYGWGGGFPAPVYAGYPTGPLYTGPPPIYPQTINTMNPLGGSIMNSIAPGSWRRFP